MHLAFATAYYVAMGWSPHVTLVHGERQRQGTRGLVAMTSAQHAEGRQFDPGRVYAQQHLLGDGQRAFGTVSIVRMYCVPITMERAHPDLNQGPADLQSAALATELCTRVVASIETARQPIHHLHASWRTRVHLPHGPVA